VKTARLRGHRFAGPARLAAPVLVVALLSGAGFVLTTHAVDADRDRATQRRADLAAQQVRGALERARTFAVGLGSALEGERAPSGRRFAALEGSATATVGLTAALWVERIAARDRRAYERRIHGPIRTLAGRRIAGPAPAYLPATFRTSLALPQGVDVSGVPALGATLRDPTSVFAGTATPSGTFAGRQGFFLVQAARFGRGVGSDGFLVVFVPSGWLGLSLDEDVRRLVIRLDGRRLEGGLATAPAASTSFVDLTRRWQVDVGQEPATATQATLPWLALAWPAATALLLYLVGRGILRRRRAERQVDDIFDLSLDLLCVAGVDGYFKRVNPAFERTLGYTSAQLLSRPIVDFVHPDDRAATRHAIDSLARDEAVDRFSNRYVRSDGEVRWLEWSTRVVPERGLMYAAARDVTENRILVGEQAALRRVATRIAEGDHPADLFEAVAVEIGQLLEADVTRLLRYEEDGAASIVAGYGARDPALDVGARMTLDASQVWGRVARDGSALRTDHLDAGSDRLARSLRQLDARAAVAAPIVVSGRVWGVIVAAFRRTEAVHADTEARIAQFTELVATAVANAQSGAELAASRRRIVETADDTRRRIERNLHDGAQQRLVHTIITLELARSTLPDDDPSARLVSEALEHAQHAIAETRELAQGIHPAILSRHGLVAALEDLVDRSAVPVTLDAHITRHLPASVEVTAYYVISEALANVAKHASASCADVTLDERNGDLELQISDDGVGGADPSRGSGLLGLKDRIEASGGSLTLESRPDHGTRLTVELPLEAPAPSISSGLS
jgi:PAS domain S-box-containing protein